MPVLNSSGDLADGVIAPAITRDAEVLDWAKTGNADLVPDAKIATGTPDGAKFLRDDRAWAIPTGGGATLTTEIPWVAAGTVLVVDQPDTSVAANRSHMIAHGLGVAPAFVSVTAKAMQADRTYAIGDVIDLTGTADGIAVQFDETNYISVSEHRRYRLHRQGRGC